MAANTLIADQAVGIDEVWNKLLRSRQIFIKFLFNIKNNNLLFRKRKG